MKIAASLLLATTSLVVAFSCTPVSETVTGTGGGAGLPANGASCAAGTADCGTGVCQSIISDAQNCGACNSPCPTNLPFCSSGTCTATCNLSTCGAECVNTASDFFHCGACSSPCGNGQTCSGSVCVGGAATGAGGAGSGVGAGTGGAGVVVGAGGTGLGVGGTGVGVGGTGVGVGGTGAGGTVATGVGGSVSTGNNPAGYWSYNTWGGCAWTGIDTEAGTTTTITPQDFTAQTGGPYCVSGTVHSEYESVALLGFNLAEPAAGADCTYKPVVEGEAGPPSVALTGTGLAISFAKKVATTLRVQIQGPNGASDENDRWCYTITDASGPVFAPYAEFNTMCWDGEGNDYAGEPISAVVFLTPGATSTTDFDYCIDGFADGSSAADAPDGTELGPLSGTIGGAGSEDLDFQRVKVKKDGKSYIIQNNNWGNPGGTDQTIQYTDNSFKITGATGSGPGGGVPASFPSIYIGANGDVQGGTFSTTSDDGLPKQVSSIGTINTTFTWGGSQGGDFNATYDVWFAASAPAAGSYEDGINGFVMVWFYKPSGNQPIGSVSRTATIAGKTWDVWVGPRGGDGSNSGAPVVSYVAQGSLNTLTFDLNDFIKDAATDGIQSSWYLTDVFGGFEIWNGGGTAGLEVSEFSVDVQ